MLFPIPGKHGVKGLYKRLILKLEARGQHALIIETEMLVNPEEM